MIVVIEGPSAAGKTTWAVANAGLSLVPDSRPTTEAPSGSTAAARFWTDHHGERWSRALALERTTGLAVFDTDPLKLHYAWSLGRVGTGSPEDFQCQAQAYRDAIGAHHVGFADRYLVLIPDATALRRRRAADATRRRRNFELHVRLVEPLRDWYGALEQVRPGSVVWSLSRDALRDPVGDRYRYSLGDFDALMERLSRS